MAWRAPDAVALKMMLGFRAASGLLRSAIEKRGYLRRAERGFNRSFEEAYALIASQAAATINTCLEPGGGYVGVWVRDAASILRAMVHLGNVDEAVEGLKRIWGCQLNKDSKVLYGGGSPSTRFRVSRACRDVVARWVGALPTVILDGYQELYGANPDIDSTALLISSTCEVCTSTGRLDALRRLKPRIRLAMGYLEGRVDNDTPLLRQGPNEEWMDVMLREGVVTYSQAVWAGALSTYANACRVLGADVEAEAVRDRLRKVLRVIDERLWDGSKYADVMNSEGEASERTSQDTVLLLSISGVDEAKAIRHLATLKMELWKPVGPAVLCPPSRHTLPRRLGDWEYQNGGFWPWITAEEIIARTRFGGIEEALLLLGKALPYAAVEWVDPYTARRSGAYPFRSGLAAVLRAAEAVRRALRAGLAEN